MINFFDGIHHILNNLLCWKYFVRVVIFGLLITPWSCGFFTNHIIVDIIDWFNVGIGVIFVARIWSVRKELVIRHFWKKFASFYSSRTQIWLITSLFLWIFTIWRADLYFCQYESALKYEWNCCLRVFRHRLQCIHFYWTDYFYVKFHYATFTIHKYPISKNCFSLKLFSKHISEVKWSKNHSLVRNHRTCTLVTKVLADESAVLFKHKKHKTKKFWSKITSFDDLYGSKMATLKFDCWVSRPIFH